MNDRIGYGNDPKMLKAMISYLLDSWEGALHSRDSIFQIAHEVPDWERRYHETLNDPMRIQYTQGQFAGVRKLFDAIFQGTVTDSLLEQALEELKKLPN